MAAEKRKTLVEVCVDSIASAIAAERGGAGRIELCSGLNEGGVTPSVGLIEKVRASIKIPLHVMIRPRAGDFFYDDHEYCTMIRDIEVSKGCGANGVVVGILLASGQVDVSRVANLVELARPLSVTFHRAFDMTPDLFRALDEVCATGADRLLSSGGAATALEGSGTLAELVKECGDRIVIMAGSGIKLANARKLIEETGVAEIHGGLRRTLPSPMIYRAPQVSIGATSGREYERFVVLEQDVRDLCAALD